MPPDSSKSHGGTLLLCRTERRFGFMRILRSLFIKVGESLAPPARRRGVLVESAPPPLPGVALWSRDRDWQGLEAPSSARRVGAAPARSDSRTTARVLLAREFAAAPPPCGCSRPQMT